MTRLLAPALVLVALVMPSPSRPLTPIVSTGTPSVSVPAAVREAASRAANLTRKTRPVPKPPVVWDTAVASTFFEAQSPASGRYYHGEGHGWLLVAHKTLPLGTRVAFRYHASKSAPWKTIEAVVGDRGPYVSGRTFDLAWATAQALGIGDTVVTLEYRVLGR